MFHTFDTPSTVNSLITNLPPRWCLDWVGTLFITVVALRSTPAYTLDSPMGFIVGDNFAVVAKKNPLLERVLFCS